MTLVELARRYPSMRKILLRNRGRVLKMEMELRRRQAREAPKPNYGRFLL